MDRQIADKAMHVARNCRDTNASLTAAVDQLHSIQRRVDELQLRCEATRERIEETIAIIDRFFETEPQEFLTEMREIMMEFLLDSSRSQNSEAYKWLLSRID